MEQIIRYIQQIGARYTLDVEGPLVGCVFDTFGNPCCSSASHVPLLGYHSVSDGPYDPFGFIHPQDAERVRGTFEGMLANQQRVECEYRAKHSTGGWIDFHSVGDPLFVEGALRGYVVISRIVGPVDMERFMRFMTQENGRSAETRRAPAILQHQ